MLDRKQRELLEEEISAEEYGENPETKPAHLEAKASSLREDAIALEEAADMARKRIERHRRQRTRELENRAKELRDEARDLERKAYALREDEADYGGKYIATAASRETAFEFSSRNGNSESGRLEDCLRETCVCVIVCVCVF